MDFNLEKFSQRDLVKLKEQIRERENQIKVQREKDLQKSVFVISHESDMREIFERAIIVKKENGISSLEMVM